MRIFLTAITLSILLMGNASAQKAKKYVPPPFSAKSYLIADSDGNIIKEHDIHDIMPIASITKLMVALLATEQALDEELAIVHQKNISTRIPKSVKTLTRRELLILSLVKSDNLAAQILCDNMLDCVNRMNLKAKDIGMEDTYYVEPTGLSAENKSTASDLLKLMMIANDNSTLSELSSMPTAEIPTSGKPIKIRNTNPLTKKLDVILSKTGYISIAGGCIVMTMNSPVGRKILILLGSKNARTRIPDAERLVNEFIKS